MKDAGGHGSNPRGGGGGGGTAAHATGVDQVGKGFRSAAPAEFLAARNQSTRSEMFTPHTPDELASFNLFMNHEKTIGAAVDPKGDIQSVFNNSGVKGAGGAAIEEAKARGGNHLDAFDGKLPGIYKAHGFEEVKREKNWTPGGADVVYMKLKGAK